MTKHARHQDPYGRYEVPPWLAPHLDLVGGEMEVVRLMSGPRALGIRDPALAVAQERMSAKVDVIRALHESGRLAQPPGAVGVAGVV